MSTHAAPAATLADVGWQKWLPVAAAAAPVATWAVSTLANWPHTAGTVAAVTVAAVMVWLWAAWPGAAAAATSTLACCAAQFGVAAAVAPPWVPGGGPDPANVWASWSLAVLATVAAFALPVRRGRTAAAYLVAHLLVLPLPALAAARPSLATAATVAVLAAWFLWVGGWGRLPRVLMAVRQARKNGGRVASDLPPADWPSIPDGWVQLHGRSLHHRRRTGPGFSLLVGPTSAAVVVDGRGTDTTTGRAARAAVRAVDAATWALKTPRGLIHPVVIVDRAHSPRPAWSPGRPPRQVWFAPASGVTRVVKRLGAGTADVSPARPGQGGRAVRAARRRARRDLAVLETLPFVADRLLPYRGEAG